MIFWKVFKELTYFSVFKKKGKSRIISTLEAWNNSPVKFSWPELLGRILLLDFLFSNLLIYWNILKPFSNYFYKSLVFPLSIYDDIKDISPEEKRVFSSLLRADGPLSLSYMTGIHYDDFIKHMECLGKKIHEHHKQHSKWKIIISVEIKQKIHGDYIKHLILVLNVVVLDKFRR